MSTKKVKISNGILGDLDFNVGQLECCGLAEGRGIGAGTTVEELLALRYKAGEYSEDRNAVIVTTQPKERAVYPRLIEAGFKEVAEFPSKMGRYKVKLWFALTLKDRQVEILERCDGCGVALTAKNRESGIGGYCKKCW